METTQTGAPGRAAGRRQPTPKDNMRRGQQGQPSWPAVVAGQGAVVGRESRRRRTQATYEWTQSTG